MSSDAHVEKFADNRARTVWNNGLDMRCARRLTVTFIAVLQ
jgi:hypothetical protein